MDGGERGVSDGGEWARTKEEMGSVVRSIQSAPKSLSFFLSHVSFATVIIADVGYSTPRLDGTPVRPL